MYNEYWGFNRSPFSGRLNSDGIYEGPSHEEALARLAYTVEECRQGALLVGEAGIGKTAILEEFARRCRRPNREIALVRAPGFGGRDLYYDLAQEFGLAPERTADEAEIWRQLKDHVTANRLNGTQTVIVVDQAHMIAADAEQMRSLHMLYYLDSQSEARYTVVLSARPELVRLARAEVLEWSDLGMTLEPFSEPQTGLYISHLIRWAGRTEQVFTRDAIGRVHDLAGGIPRQINRICNLALLAACSDELSEVDIEVIESVYQELCPESALNQVAEAI